MKIELLFVLTLSLLVNSNLLNSGPTSTNKDLQIDEYKKLNIPEELFPSLLLEKKRRDSSRAFLIPNEEDPNLSKWANPQNSSKITPQITTTEVLSGHIMPSFIVFGAQKCGTTSMYRYLLKHPQITPIEKKVLGGKEARFFEPKANKQKGLEEYLSLFTSEGAFEKLRMIDKKTPPFITGEATPGYIYYPEVADKIASVVPNIKLIVMLRNPISRANSHFQHSQALISAKDKSGFSSVSSLIFQEMSLLYECMKEYPEILINLSVKYQKGFLNCHAEKVKNATTKNSKRLTEMNNEKNRKNGLERTNNAKPNQNFRNITNTRRITQAPHRQNQNLNREKTRMRQSQNQNPRKRNFEIKKLETWSNETSVKKMTTWTLQLLMRGIYLTQLIPWINNFKPEQLYFIKSEDFYRNTALEMRKLSLFLGITDIDWTEMIKNKYNFGANNFITESDSKVVRYEPLPKDVEGFMFDFFKPFNDKLEEVIGINWKRGEYI